MRSLAEQAAAKGVEVEALLGKTPAEVRALGFEVHESVPSDATLRREDPNLEVDTSVTGRRTGLVWHRPAFPAVLADEMSAALGRAIDEEVLAEILNPPKALASATDLDFHRSLRLKYPPRS